MDAGTWFAAERYASVGTYRRSGEVVSCPVWCATDGATMLFRSFARTGKVRRLARDPRVLVAPCTRDGTVTGTPRPGTASVLTGAAARRAGRLLTRRQGWVKPVSDLVYRLRLGRITSYAVRLDAEPGG